MIKELEVYFDRLWPICRSIAGPGFRESLDILSEIAPFKRLRFASGKEVLDWTVPPEWRANKAYLIDPHGKKRADFSKNNLHLLNFSEPFQGTMPLKELKKHLYTLPSQPKAIPYLTSYYKRRWGFCLTHEEYLKLPEGQYTVVVDTEIKKGFLEIGEAVLPGRSKQEILFSSYLCHPSLANNELSGPLALTFLYQKVAAMKNRNFTYRFAIMPETIGAICYLSLRGEHLKKWVTAGYTMTCVADPGHFTYKRSRQENSLANVTAETVLKKFGKHEALDFDPSAGSDERQYCSPGFNLPIGSLMRTPYGRYKEYHTSLDNKEFISFKALQQSVEVYHAIVRRLETREIWKNTIFCGEPQLGKRGLYPTLGSQKARNHRAAAMLWFLNLADGTRDLEQIAQTSGQPLSVLKALSRDLEKAGLIQKIVG